MNKLLLIRWVGLWSSITIITSSALEQKLVEETVCGKSIMDCFNLLVDDLARIGQWKSVISISEDINLPHSFGPVTQLSCDADMTVFNQLLKTYSNGLLYIVIACPNITRILMSIQPSSNLRWFRIRVLILDREKLDMVILRRKFNQVFKENDTLLTMTPRLNHAMFGQLESCRNGFHYTIPAINPLQDNSKTWNQVSKIILSKRTSNLRGLGQFPDDLILDVVGVPSAPFFIKRSDGSYDGLDFNIVDTLSKELGFRYHISIQDDGVWGGPMANGRWSGMVGQVYHGTKDVAISAISLSESRLKGVDYTRQHAQSPAGLLLNLRPDKTHYFTNPFDFKTWLVVLVLPALTTIMYLVANKFFNPNFCKQDIQTTSQVLQYNYGILFAQGEIPRLQARGVSILIGGYLLTSFCLIAIYTGNLTASLAIERRTWPFRTLKGFADSDYKFYVPRGTNFEQVLRHSNISTHQQLWAKVMENPAKYLHDPTIGPSELDLTKAVSVGDRGDLENKARKYCDFAILPEDLLGPIGMGIVVAKDSPLKAAFDPIILRLAEMGLVEYWYKKGRPRDNCAKRNANRVSAAVTLEDISLILQAVLGGGLGLATTVLVLELVSKRLTHKKNGAGL